MFSQSIGIFLCFLVANHYTITYMSKRKPFNSLEISGMISEEGLNYSEFPAKLGQGVVPSGRKQVSLCAATLRTAGRAPGRGLRVDD